MVFDPLITISCPAFEVFKGLSLTIHFPESSAVVSTVWPENETETFSPGAAVPKIGTGRLRCNTMWSVKKLAGLTSERAMDAHAMAHAMMSLFFIMLFSCVFILREVPRRVQPSVFRINSIILFRSSAAFTLISR